MEIGKLLPTQRALLVPMFEKLAEQLPGILGQRNIADSRKILECFRWFKDDRLMKNCILKFKSLTELDFL